MRPQTPTPLLLAIGCATTVLAASGDSDKWQVAGQLGLLKFIVVPETAAKDRTYYDQAIKELCSPDDTCFLRFFTNSQHAALGIPLADAIEKEPTAMFQRSAKQQREMFQWSCRMKMPDACF